MAGNSLIQVMAAGLAPRFSAQALKAVDPTRGSGGWMGVIRESFAGAWQRSIVIDNEADMLRFSGVFAPVTLIAGDLSKMRVKLMEESDNGTDVEIYDSPFLPVMRKPNHYQTRIQYWEHYFICKIIGGNVYVLKVRDLRGIVTAKHILNPHRTTPLVTETGDVYYELQPDDLAGKPGKVVVPASEIIHDRMNCLWHPLVGVSPLYACGTSATQGRRIQANSTKFFDNMSRPSGVLTAPGQIGDELAQRMKREWDENFSGGNIGRTAVLGDGLKYEAMTIPAQQAQLAEQLNWTVADVARTLHVPMYKLGGPAPTGSVEALQQTYYNDCLHVLIEAAELCLDEGLALGKNKPLYWSEFDINNLLRMDNAAQLDALGKAVDAAIMAPDEARRERNLPPVPGGKYPYLQQQNYSLEALSKRDAAADPFAAGKPAAPAPPAREAANDEDADEAARAAAELIDRISAGLCDHPSN